jgi:hypothetical protein
LWGGSSWYLDVKQVIIPRYPSIHQYSYLKMFDLKQLRIGFIMKENKRSTGKLKEKR